MTTPIVEETPPTTEVETPKKKKNPRLPWILGGIAMVLVLAGIGAFAGYQAGVQDRQSLRATQVASQSMEQYTLGLKDMAEGRLEVARQRFEAIIQMDPSFPGAVDRLAEVMLAIQVTNAPTPIPTPTIEPTPDLRSAEELLAQVKQNLTDQNWQGAIDTLDNLRREKADFEVVAVDGMYFVALRNLGMQKISEGALEMGLYDLALAERFGYLDGQAIGLRNITRLYLTGASFWGIDWKQASLYFGEVYPYFPSLRDGTNQTARDRYRISTLNYADDLAAAGDVCGAQALYEAVMQLGMDPTVQPTLDSVTEACNGGASSSEPPADATPDPGAVTPPLAETPGAAVTPDPGGVQPTPETGVNPPTPDTAQTTPSP